MEKQIFIKNSSSQVNFGYYDLDVKFLTDGGRVFLDREYKAKIEVDEKNIKMRITLYEEKVEGK